MSTPTYANFDLLIDRGPTGYRARVIRSLAGEASTDFALPFTEEELADFLWRTASGTRHLGVAPDEAGSTLDPRAFGARLYAAAFAGPVGLCLRRSLDEAERRGVGLRLRLRLDASVLDLAELPWEFLFVPDLDRFLALSDLTPIVRYVELDRPVQPLRARLPLTVLAIVSNPSGVQPLALEREWQNLQVALNPLVQRGVIALERLETATLPALQARLRRGPVDLLHFVGHGFFDPKSNTGGLVFENDRGQSEIATAETLGMLLHDHEALRLIFLNACEGAQGGRSDPFAGIAQRLAQQGAPAVLAMQFLVTDAAAIALSQAFYQSLADGLPADAALSEARKAIAAQGNPLEWATPVLFSRSEDNRLFDLQDVLPVPDCPYPGMVPFRAEDARFFYGREDEIEQMLRHLRHQRLLFVIGPSGSGKSSLVAAGLLPKLASSSYFPQGTWLVQTLRPGGRPLETLAAAIQGDVSNLTEAVPRLLAANAPAQRLLLVIDQFEETFSLAGSDERQQFIAVIQALRKTELCALLVAMRADFYPDLMNSDLWPVDASQRLEIAALRGDALRRAISQPADQVEVDIEGALVERLMADAAGEPGVLPMLQETLVLLWGRMSRRRISLENYEQLGDGQRSGLAVAIATKADATLVDLTPDEQGIAWRIFLRLIQFGQGRADTRRQLPEAELRSADDHPGAFDRVLKHLADNRLLTLTGGEDGAVRLVDISHERLITEWPKLNEWVKHHKEAEQMRRRLEVKAQEWVRLGRGEGGLLDEAELAEAYAWLADPITRDLGISDDLRTLEEVSRKAINPGWHPRGTVGLVLGGATLAAFLALMYLWLVLSRTPGTARLPLLVFIIVLVAFTIFAFVQSRKSDPFLLQRTSNTIARQRPLGLGIGALAVLVTALWIGYAVPGVAIDNKCRDLGYENDTPVSTVALISQGVDPLGVEAFRSVLQLKSVREIRVYLATLNNALLCKQFFRYRMTLRSETALNGSEIAIIADIFESKSGRQLETARALGAKNCSLFGFTAKKAAQILGYENVVAIDEETGLPGPSDCQPYIAYEEGYAALDLGNYEDAERAFLRAISYFHDYASAHGKLGIVYYSTGRYSEGVRELETAVALSGDSPFVPFLVHLAWACYRAGDVECAVDRNHQAIAIDPKQKNAYNNLAVVYREIGDYQNAHTLLDQYEALFSSVSANSENTDVERFLARHRGILAYYEGNWAEATRLLENADEPGLTFEEEIVYYLAKSAAQQGSTSAACLYWKRYDQITSKNLFGETERRRDADEQMTTMGCCGAGPC